MTNRARNFSILAVVILLLGAAGYVIATKETRLGLDLKGGIELVYQGQPTPQVPRVTPEAIDDAIKTIRKRTDALGVGAIGEAALDLGDVAAAHDRRGVVADRRLAVDQRLHQSPQPLQHGRVGLGHVPGHQMSLGVGREKRRPVEPCHGSATSRSSEIRLARWQEPVTPAPR